jgi:hypothetical protein
MATGIQQVPIVTCVIVSGADGFIAVMAGSQNCLDCVEKIHDPCTITDGDGSMSFHVKTMLNLFSPAAENCEARESMSRTSCRFGIKRTHIGIRTSLILLTQ